MTSPAPGDAATVRPTAGGRRQPLLSVIVPGLNEEHAIPPLLDRLRPVLDGLDVDWEAIFVDDGSADGTMNLLRELNARDPRIRAVSLSRNFGKEIATAAGLAYASGDAAVLMDADLQHPPELIADFMRHWREGAEMVYGKRIDRDADSPLHRLSARLFYATFGRLSGTALPDGAGDFRLFDRKALDAMNRLGERVRFNKGLYAWIGFRTVGVPFSVPPRMAGRSRWRIRRLVHYAFDGLASFSTIPLRVWSYLGLLISLFAFCYAVTILVKTLIYGIDVPGFPSLIISVMFFAGVQLISLGVMGEYLGRMYEEVKGRPLYLVAEELGLERNARTGAGSGADTVAGGERRV
ncbi:MAG TPA: glycosyltransferase family 2 protein [Hyphomicrobiaceae bacterium]|nr:glycosyltransferase family 2 protein [Hyphomicrobiaceae bacterium]